MDSLPQVIPVVNAVLPPIFEWTAQGGPGRGSGGVAGSGDQATADLLLAMLRLPPGATGHLRHVRLDHEQPLDYLTAGPLILARHHAPGVVRLTGGPR
ncbi:hypothetical protein AB0I81_23075 [Nonomuraea sp. NPDC050404]|uniref:hypothetical protein n=1 Tax=Nonomuraea sp. NPDC050404 TaxID=3155783 RepID=UPI0033EAA7C8